MNHGVRGWNPLRPHDLRIDCGAVRRVLSDIHSVAEGMVWDEDVHVYGHAARGVLVLVFQRGGAVGDLEREGMSEVHLGM
jgi:hypothetical protein